MRRAAMVKNNNKNILADPHLEITVRKVKLKIFIDQTLFKAFGNVAEVNIELQQIESKPPKSHKNLLTLTKCTSPNKAE